MRTTRCCIGSSFVYSSRNKRLTVLGILLAAFSMRILRDILPLCLRDGNKIKEIAGGRYFQWTPVCFDDSNFKLLQ